MKKKIGLYVEESLAKQLDGWAEKLGGAKGVVVEAALHMFFSAEAETQKQALQGAAVRWIDEAMPGAGDKRLRVAAQEDEKKGRKPENGH